MKKYSIPLVIITVVLLSGYWLKCQTHINIFPFSFSSIFPFSLFQKHRVIVPQHPGIVLQDSFDRRHLFDTWTVLWMREPGTVRKMYEPAGYNETRCIRIDSTSEKSWTCAHDALVKVKQGDAFTMQGMVMVEGDNVSGGISIAAFDKDRKPLHWNYRIKAVDTPGQWFAVTDDFSIASRISFIQLRLCGKGIGEFFFDDVVLEKNINI